MEEVAKQGVVRVIWNSKDVTTEIQKYLSSVTYTDNEEDASDEATFIFDNSTAIWSNDYYPTQGDTIQLFIGYQNKQVECGLFEVDEITLSGMPDIIEIKSLAVGITKSFRTRNNKAFEAQTLKQIALFFCKKHGLILIDTTSMLSQINLERKTQQDETDLQFLSKVSKEFGFLFSVKGSKLVFISYYDLDNQKSIGEVDKTEVSNYNLTEKCYDTYASSKVIKRNPKTGKIVKWEGKEVLNTKSTDSQLFHGNITNTSQAETRVKGGLWDKNKFKQSGNLNGLPGDPTLIAGVNFDLTGFGNGSGQYHIVRSTHTVSGDGAYSTSIEIRKTGTIPAPKRVPKIVSESKTKKQEVYESLGEEETEENEQP